MKRTVLRLAVAGTLALTVAGGCKAKRTGKVSANNPVPQNGVNNDSTGTTPRAKLAPAPVPNVRPNPIPNPQPPSPPM